MPHRFQLLRAPLRVASIALFVSGHVFGQAPPFVHTQVAAPAGTPSTLDGMLVANNLPATSWFEWGTSTNYGSIAEVTDTFSDTRVHRVSAPISGLANGVTYHFRLVGSNSAGVVYGMDHVFRVEAAYGKLAAWGANDSGQCTIPAGISNLVALVGTYSGSIALRADGTLAFWGTNPPGLAALAASVTNIVAVSASYAHVLALDADGLVHACGAGGLGGAGGATNIPVGLSNVVAIAAGGSDGDYHSLAVTADGRVVAWGKNNVGQISVPPSLTNVVAVSAGDYHSLALRANGAVVAWGDNSFGQTNTLGFPPLFTAIASAFFHNLALMRDGRVFGWGDTYGGSVPYALTNVIAIATGSEHSEALRADGTVTAWGHVGNQGSATPPVGLSNVVSIAAGDDHILALGHNAAPQISSMVTWTWPNTDLPIRLSGAFDANNDPVQVFIKFPPTAGALFQYNAGARGAAITSGPTLITDPLLRVIYSPPSNSVATVYGAFHYVASDGELESGVQSPTVQILPPSAPRLETKNSGLRSSGDFELNFTAQVGATYRLWGTTNLLDWEPLGFGTATSNGWFQFFDPAAAKRPCRFYRATAP